MLSLCLVQQFWIIANNIQITFDQVAALLNTVGAEEGIAWRIEAVVEHFIYGSRCNVTAGIAARVVDKELAVIISNGAITENNIRDIANTLFTERCNKVTTWAGNYFTGIINVADESIQDVA